MSDDLNHVNVDKLTDIGYLYNQYLIECCSIIEYHRVMQIDECKLMMKPQSVESNWVIFV